MEAEQNRPVDEAQAYIDALRARKRRNLLLGAAAAALLALLLIPRLLSLFEKPEALDEAQVLAKVPALALTQAELELAGTILDCEPLRSALTYEATGAVSFTHAEVDEVFAPILPDGAAIEAIGVQGAVIYVDYSAEDGRVLLEYVDADRSGSIDRIHKSVAAGDGVFCLERTVRSGEVRYTRGTDWTE